jgi:hypothetical protein
VVIRLFLVIAWHDALVAGSHYSERPRNARAQATTSASASNPGAVARLVGAARRVDDWDGSMPVDAKPH